ncbi:FecCD family ABC transporter permease [Aliirhizobium smilacinae]|uniref:FecCD family ABC transporter permease n=1 Tax=Aliirhizobium smilacinae TaxID=1395944 RepID=UPI0015D6272A|nr:iron chelate uptake ABC transporter family permease subunit [Rhizobium smilacinae]
MKAAVGLVLLFFVAVALTLVVGVRNAGIVDVWQAFFAFDASDPTHAVIRSVRAPRLIAGLIAGAGLGMAGTVMQAVTRNPLADPGLLGVNAGAAFAVVVGALVTGYADSGMMAALAFPGAAIASIAVFLVGGARSGAGSPVRLTLAGVAINALLLSLVSAIILSRNETLEIFRFWVTGSLAQANARPLEAMFIALVVGAGISAVIAPRIEALALGSTLARGLGTKPGAVQLSALAAITLMTGAAVAVAGPIAFVGLVVPPLARRIGRHVLRRELVVSAILGGSMILLADTVGRLVVAPAEIRVGIMTALVGAPAFIFVVRRLKPGALT